MTDPPLTIADQPAASRYEARLGAQLAGFLEYRLVGARRVLVHTEVLGSFEGRGIGTALARHALEAARAAGSRVIVTCPFIRGWLERHPEYADIVVAAAEGRARA